MSTATRRRLLAVPFVLVLAFSAYTFFTPGNDLPQNVNLWDKAGHALVFAALALTGGLAGVRRLPLGLGLFAYGVLVELLQWQLPIQRDGDWHDVVADTIGLLLGLVVVISLRQRHRRR